LENSLLIKADPYNQPVVTMYYSVKEEQMENRILTMEKMLLDENVLQNVVEEMEWSIDSKYIEELITITSKEDIICVEITADTKENSRKIADILANVVNGTFGSPTIEENTKENLSLADKFAEVHERNEEAQAIANDYEGSLTYRQKKLCQMMIDEYMSGQEETDSQMAEELVYIKTTLNSSHILFGILMGLAAAAVCTGIYFMSGKSADKEDIVRGLNQS
jgi:hypothetical protein